MAVQPVTPPELVVTQALRTDVPVVEEYVDWFRAELVEGGLHPSAGAVGETEAPKAIGTGVADVGRRLRGRARDPERVRRHLRRAV